MNEQQRQAYLKAMGIQLWFPRFILPVAKFSSIYDQMEALVQPGVNAKKDVIFHSESKVEKTSRQVKAEPFNQVLDALQESPANMSIPVTPQRLEKQASSSSIAMGKVVTDKVITSEVVTDKTPHVESTAFVKKLASPFRITAISLTDTCLVVTDMPLTESAVLSVASKRLLYALVFALGWSTANPALWKVDTMEWPLPGLKGDLGEHDASEAVQGFLNHRFGFSHRQRVLLLGAFSTKHVLDCYHEFESMHGVYKKEGGFRWGVSYSLDQMLKIPALKAEVWAHLSPLAEKQYE